MKYILKNMVLVAALTLATMTPTLAASNCYVDYKAKQNTSGLKLHYGVMKLPKGACANNTRAQKLVSKRLANGGWKLLRIPEYPATRTDSIRPPIPGYPATCGLLH